MVVGGREVGVVVFGCAPGGSAGGGGKSLVEMTRNESTTSTELGLQSVRVVEIVSSLNVADDLFCCY